MKNPVIYIVLNGELKMSPGKAAAQAVHAAMMLSLGSNSDFLSDRKRTVIVLEAKNADQIRGIDEYLSDSNVDADYYIDEGKNEVDAYSITALAAFAGDDLDKREIFESLPLYRGHVMVKRARDFRPNFDKISIKDGTVIGSHFAFNLLKRAQDNIE